MDACNPIVLIAISLLRSNPDNHSITERFRMFVMEPNHELRMRDFEVDHIWFHIRNEHKEWADFIMLHSDEKSFENVRDLLYLGDGEDLEVLEKRPPTFGGLKRTMNDLIELDHHLEAKSERATSGKQRYKSRYFCPE
ncbi:hypothetical protein MMC11_004037 [Xylographa trunciseda]|nr:hypothetical protein [Xylographa trunciseda]